MNRYCYLQELKIKKGNIESFLLRIASEVIIDCIFERDPWYSFKWIRLFFRKKIIEAED